MTGLHLLKHMKGLSDEETCATWLENPYFQAFCGETYFQHRLPIDRSSMTRWRQRIGADDLEALLAEMISGFAEEIDHAGGAEAILSDKVKEISETCNDLMKVTVESGFPYKSTLIELDYDFDLNKFASFRTIASAAAGLFSGGLAPAAFYAGGLASTIKISPGRALKKARYTNSPFASLL